MGQALQPAPAGNYERRRPEETTLYQLVQEHLETFLAQVETETGASLPNFVKGEFDAFLECGILAHVSRPAETTFGGDGRTSRAALLTLPEFSSSRSERPR